MGEPTALPYSYHTFMLAFRFDGQFPSGSEHGNWKEDSLRSPSDESELPLNFQTYQYFTPEARQLMFNKDTIKRFKYSFPDDANREYIIRKTFAGKPRRMEEYRLWIDNIRVTKFQNNIAIIQFELENFDAEHQNLESVKRINEYGRRINMPFLVDSKVIHPLTADSIAIMGSEVTFQKFGEESLKQFRESADKQTIIPPIMRLIRELLCLQPNETANIKPVINDRMFVCCLVRDEAFSQEIKSVRYEENAAIPVCGKDIYTDRELANKIYAFAYIDAEDSSCQSPEMREALLRRCVYSRWRDWGTFDVITHHSLVRLTGAWDGLRDSVINPFLTQYTVMAAGALLQRATAMKLSEDCADISSAYFNGNETEALNDSILRLKRDYVYAQNNIFLNHFTAQEQGIDEFDMMRSEMYIKDSLKNLSYKVNGIYDFTTASAEEEETHLLNMLTYFGLPLSVMHVLLVILSFVWFQHNEVLQWIIFGIILIISSVFSYIILKCYREQIRRKKAKNE